MPKEKFLLAKLKKAEDALAYAKSLLNEVIEKGCVSENGIRCVYCYRDLRFNEHMRNCLFMRCAQTIGLSGSVYKRKRIDKWEAKKDLSLKGM